MEIDGEEELEDELDGDQMEINEGLLRISLSSAWSLLLYHHACWILSPWIYDMTLVRGSAEGYGGRWFSPLCSSIQDLGLILSKSLLLGEETEAQLKEQAGIQTAQSGQTFTAEVPMLRYRTTHVTGLVTRTSRPGGGRYEESKSGLK
jgi:hypothetical protein